MNQKDLYKTTILKSVEWAKERGVDRYVICFGEPVTKTIKKQYFDISLEEIQDIEIGIYQTEIITLKSGTKAMRIILSKKQLFNAVPDRWFGKLPPLNVEYEIELFNHSVTTSCPVGYCHNKEHPGYVSKNIMDNRKCTAKNCGFFERYISCSIWQQKEVFKKRSKAKKEEMQG